MSLQNAGSTLQIIGNTITGKNTGVDYKGVAGSSHIIIAHNNITTKRGAVKVSGGNHVKILYNQIENAQVNDAPVGERIMVWLNGATAGSVVNTEIIGNNMNAHNIPGVRDHDVEYNIKLVNATKTKIDNNVMFQAENGTIFIDNSAVNTDIGKGHYVYSPSGPEAAIETTVTDQGVGTMGIPKEATVTGANWQNYTPSPCSTSCYETAGYLKTNKGIVNLKGMMKMSTGSPVSGTVLFTLPAAYRPSQTRVFHVASNVAAAQIEVQASTGNVVLLNGGGNYLSLDNVRYSVR
jgi:hypothetical protein